MSHMSYGKTVPNIKIALMHSNYKITLNFMIKQLIFL